MDEFLFLFTRASKLARQAADEAMSRHGVRVGQNVILEQLWIRDGQTPGQLASSLGIATPTVVRSAERMEAAGLLARRPDASDGRLVRLWLTSAGRELQPVIEQERAKLTERALADLDANEREALITALRKIVLAYGGDPTLPTRTQR
jgi:MarR family transcriptional regulator, organic hydroperoxide resistance regulator